MVDCGNNVCKKLLECFKNIGDVTFSVGPEKEEIKSKIEKIVEDECFTKLSKASLIKILKCQDVELDELQLFNGMFRWAEFQCDNAGLESTGENIRGALGELLFLLRFPLMSYESFFKVVYPKGILTAEEVAGISRTITFKGNPSFVNECPFDAKDREQKISKYGQSFRFCPQEKMFVDEVQFKGGKELPDWGQFKVRLCISENDLDNVCHESSLIRNGASFRGTFSMDIYPPLALKKKHVYHLQFDIQEKTATSILSGLQLRSINFAAAP